MLQIPIVMPQLGESIAEATIVQIHISPGDEVTADQEIIEVETNKAVMSVTTPCAGRVATIAAELDVSYAVGAILGQLEVSIAEATRAGIMPTEKEEVPASEAIFEESLEGPEPDRPHFGYPEETLGEGETHPTVKPTVEGLPVPATATGASYMSPRMRARMQDLSLNAADLAGVAGSGAGGRVTIDDLENFISDLDRNKMTAASPMRLAVADSMRRSWTRPLATVGAPIVLDPVLAHRKTAHQKPGPALYVVRALALAIAENTAVAGRLVGHQIVHPSSVDIGFAVEVVDGVLVPVIREVDRKPLAQLVSIYDALVEQARNRRLPHDASGAGIATVTNFGTFGIVWATPIPLPEQNLVLGLGAGRKNPVWNRDRGIFEPVTEAELTLSFDHRVLDGGAAGRLLTRVGELLQKPELL